MRVIESICYCAGVLSLVLAASVTVLAQEAPEVGPKPPLVVKPMESRLGNLIGHAADGKSNYRRYCAGCHGAHGRGGATIALSNPVYLAIADENVVRKVIANGVHGTSMPAFAQSAGGMLTDKQIDAITSGIFSHWRRKGLLDGTNAPAYAAKAAGNAAHGELAYGTYCASCHGPEGQGGPKGSAIAVGKARE